MALHFHTCGTDDIYEFSQSPHVSFVDLILVELLEVGCILSSFSVEVVVVYLIDPIDEGLCCITLGFDAGFYRVSSKLSCGLN